VKVWDRGGLSNCHSKEDVWYWFFIINRWDKILSQIIYINKIKLKKDNKDPHDEIVFHFVKKSG